MSGRWRPGWWRRWRDGRDTRDDFRTAVVLSRFDRVLDDLEVVVAGYLAETGGDHV